MNWWTRQPGNLSTSLPIPLRLAKLVCQQVGYERMARAMGDHKRHLCLQSHLLRGDAAGPEHGGLAGGQLIHLRSDDGIGKIGADGGWIADVDRSAVIPRETGRQLGGDDRLCRGEIAQGYDQPST